MMSLRSPSFRPCFVADPVRIRATASAAPRAATVARTRAAVTMYELLSVDKAAAPEEIKAAYRREARRWHPDTCRAAADKSYFAEQFMRAREAYEVLSDPDLRRDYDLALVRPADGWMAAVGRGVAFRKSAASRGGDWGFGDWESQLEGLRGRRSGGAAAGRRRGDGESWGSQIRRSRGVEFSN